MNVEGKGGWVIKKRAEKLSLYPVVSSIFVGINFKFAGLMKITVSKIRKFVNNDPMNTMC